MTYKIKVELEYTDTIEAENFDMACEKIIENACIWGEWSCNLIEKQED